MAERTRQRKYKPTVPDVKPLTPAGGEFFFQDPRLKIDIKTRELVKDLKGRAYVNYVIALQHWYDFTKQMWVASSPTTPVAVYPYWYFYSAEPPPLADSGWYPNRMDARHQLMCNSQIRDSADNIINPAKEDGNLTALTDDTIKGILRSVGDAGTTPTNTPGKTLLQYLKEQLDELYNCRAITDDTIKGLLRSIGDAGVNPTNTRRKTVLHQLNELHAYNIYQMSKILNSNFELGSTFGFYEEANIELIVQQDDIYLGNYAGKITLPSAGTGRLRIEASLYCSEYGNVDIKMAYKLISGITGFRFGIHCRDLTGTWIGYVWSDTLSPTITEWARYSRTLTPLPNTYIVVPVIEFDGSAGASAYIDHFEFMARYPESRNITNWGGVALTGADITPNLQNLDLSLTSLDSRLQLLNGKPYETNTVERYGSLAPGTTETVLDIVGYPVLLEYLDWSTNNNVDIYLGLYGYKADGTLSLAYATPNLDGTGNVPFSPSELNVQPTDLFKEIIYDTANNYFKYSLTRKLQFGNGCRITVRNTNTTTAFNCAVFSAYKTYINPASPPA